MTSSQRWVACLLAMLICVSSACSSSSQPPTSSSTSGGSAGSDPSSGSTPPSPPGPTPGSGANSVPGTGRPAPSGSAITTARVVPGGPSGSAVDAFRLWTKNWNDHSFRPMWSTIATAQRPSVPFGAFAQCQRMSAAQVGATAIDYQRTVHQRAAAARVAGGSTVTATVVTADLAFESHDPTTRRITIAWFPEGDTWHWALDAGALRAYRTGTCPH